MTIRTGSGRSTKRIALFSQGFRPFFLFGAIHAALMVSLWVPWHLGYLDLATSMAPVDWHAHELLFGYVPAIMAGFLLTALPNWTGRAPLTGKPLAALFALWFVGRFGVMFSFYLATPLTVGLAMAFPLVLLAFAMREVIASGNVRNLKVLFGVGLLCFSHGLFHAEISFRGYVMFGHHLAIASVLFLIMLIGGRMIPNFTMNWIKQVNPGSEPMPFGLFDVLAIAIAALALAAWVLLPVFDRGTVVIIVLMVLAGVAHTVRLIRWVPQRTVGEPLVLVLHVAYAFVPLGFFSIAAGVADIVSGLASGAVHAWTIGAIGLMTMAVMTRATRGHSGARLSAPLSTSCIYLALVGSTVCRLLAAVLPESATLLLTVTAFLWVAAFFLFVVFYGAMLMFALVASRRS